MFEPLISPALQHYPASYAQARANFLAALHQQVCLVRHEAIRHPAMGADGEALFTDIAWLGDENATNLLVLISATHGVEGFAGSAVQHDALLRLAHTELPPGMAVLMLHALNPWGFSHQRRVNEAGIDLNRNGVDFSRPLPEAADYAELADLVLPPDGDWPAANRRLQEYAANWGAQRLREAITRGQYSHPSGLFFGGNAPSFARQLVEGKLAEWRLDQRQTLVLDLHTGLGPFGHGELVCDHPADSPASHKARQWFQRLVSLPETGDSCSIPLTGLMDYLWHDAMRADGMYLTLEYGTYPVMRMLEVLRHDHWLYAQGAPDFSTELAQSVRTDLGEFFNPRSALWRECVLLRARQVIRTGWRCLLGMDAAV